MAGEPYVDDMVMILVVPRITREKETVVTGLKTKVGIMALRSVFDDVVIVLEAVRCRTAKMARARCIARQAVGRHEKGVGSCNRRSVSYVGLSLPLFRTPHSARIPHDGWSKTRPVH